MCDVVSVDAVIVEAEFATQEGRGQLCYELFGRIGLVAKALAECASEPLL